ncbi:YqiA/YcfP family alpha/beta fold hydrolase [Propionivibrio soli]|uniref:YqiA/YcfP family alpha/beta fold hydrolase n=1 Tax=Propionivibrio soli TaxID=2976531 RepID=UPI0021E8FC36
MSAGILYLHGFASSPQSAKARFLGETMRARGYADRFHCPALSHVPHEAIAQAERIIAREAGPLTLVGSSLGGYYATWLAEKHGLRGVVVNPAVIAPISLAKYIGPQTNLYTGQRFELTEQHVAELRALEAPIVTAGRYLLLVETGDEVLDYRHAVARYQGNRQIVLDGGDHSFVHFPQYVAQILEFAGL